MLIRRHRPHLIRESEVTPEALYVRRRELIAGAALGVAGLALPWAARADDTPRPPKLGTLRSSRYSARDEDLTPWADVTSYNNYYEFGAAKSDPAEQARSFVPRPWKVSIEGEVQKPGQVPL